MPKVRFLKFLYSNLIYKMTALFLAGLIWYIVQGEEVLDVNAKLDVKVDIASNYAIRDYSTTTKDITIRGSRVLVGNMAGRTFQAVVRIPSGKVGNLRFRLDKEFIPRWDGRLRLTIHDPYVSFVVEDKETRKIPVKANLVGTLDGSLDLDEISLSPNEVEISGVKSEVTKAKEVLTEPIDLSGVTESKKISTTISTTLYPAYSFSDTDIKASFKIGKKKIQQSFSFIPVEISDVEKVTSVKPHTVTALAVAPSDALKALSAVDFKAEVSGKGLGPGRYEIPATVLAPEGVSIIQVTPANVILEIYNQKKIK